MPYVPQAHAVQYDARAWERGQRPFLPDVPLPAPFAARVAAQLFGATSVWDALACYMCLTHGAAALEPVIQVLFGCTEEAAAGVLRTDAAGCQPWLQVALRANVRAQPCSAERVAGADAQFLLVQTRDNRRYVVDARRRPEEPLRAYGVSTGARKPPGFIQDLADVTIIEHGIVAALE